MPGLACLGLPVREGLWHCDQNTIKLQFYQPMEESRRRPIITLTTDFGLADHYVGTMKGVLLSRCPDAQLVDISHEIPCFSIWAGAYTIDQAAPFFAPQTVHLVIVDPGVGTSRRPILAEALGQYFIAPDNGVLSLVLRRHPHFTVREITRRDLWLEPVSATFHGRDLFASSAAAIASGFVKPDEIGPKVQKPELLPDIDPIETRPGVWRGKVLSIDHFGNVITNFAHNQFAQISSKRFLLSVGQYEIRNFRETFGAARAGELFAYFGSSGYIEIGINQQNAAKQIDAIPGMHLHLHLL
jgi:S-adenosylmethionine hydrolase